MVGDMKTTAPAKVSGEIQKLLTDYHQKEVITVDNIVDFHYSFESIHPFQDGNGRVGRIIMFKECLKNDIMPFIIDRQGATSFKRHLFCLLKVCGEYNSYGEMWF